MSGKKQVQCQIVYVTSQDRKDVVYVPVIFILTRLIVHVVLQGLEQNPKVREYGKNDDLLWVCL